MFRAAILSLMLMISGCSFFQGGLSVAKFDGGNYTKLVTATSMLSPSVCDPTPDKTKTSNQLISASMNSFRQQIDYVDLYEGSMIGNSDTHKNLTVVLDETDRFIALLNQIDPVGAFYCKTKIESMRHTMKMVLRAESRKPLQ